CNQLCTHTATRSLHDALPIYRRDHVARAHIRAAIVANLFDDHAASQLQVTLLLRGKINDRETEAIGCLLWRLSPALAAACDSIRSEERRVGKEWRSRGSASDL